MMNESRIPFTTLLIVCPAVAASNVLTAPLIPSEMAFPKLVQWKFCANVFANPIAVFNPCERVLPTSPQSVVSMNPFRNVAMLFAILFEVFLISSHGILCRAALSLRPTIAPTSVKSAFFQESLISFARSLNLLCTAVVSNMLSIPPRAPASAPPPDPVSEDELSSILLIWSKPNSVRLYFSASF